MINIKNFDTKLLKTDKKLYKNIDLYYNGYITTKIITDYECINSVNPSYIIIGKQMDTLKKTTETNTSYLQLQIKTKKYQKSTQNLGIRLKI